MPDLEKGMIGTTIHDRYRLDAELGRGGMAVVYRAYDTLLQRDVAVKLLSETLLDTQGRARLLREARSAASLNHPNIVTVHDAGESEISTQDKPAPYIVMELVAGLSLHKQRPEALDDILEIACQVCAALDHAHAHGVIHRDLKPENVLLTPDGTAKLVDFGLARSVASRLTTEGALVGTVFYIAPEQALGHELDGRADLYALGVLLYELTTGQLPFTGNDPLAVITKHLHAPVVPPSTHNREIPPALEALIVRLLNKEPEQRPASAAEVLEVLGSLETTLDVPPFEDAILPDSIVGFPKMEWELEKAREAERPVFVARERELARLSGFLDAALSGRGQVVFVTGGPGRGKTAMLGEFSRRAMGTHTDVLAASGNCNAYSGIGDPYLPFREILNVLTGDVASHLRTGTITREHAQRLWNVLPTAVQALLEHGPHILPVLVAGEALLSRCTAVSSQNTPWLQRLRERVERQQISSEGLEQSHIFQQVTNVMHYLAKAHPLLLMLDDLQWADSASISLLFHLGRRLEGSRILIVCAYRPEEVALGRDGQRHPLEKALAEFKRQFGDVWVDLAQVEESEGRGFVNALLETEPNRLGEDFRQELFQHTGGHPLFTIELLQAMQERGGLVQDEDGRWIKGPTLDWETLPARVEGVVEERVERLREELRDILKVASVEGEEFTAQVVARVQAIDERQLLRALSQELEKRHRLVREGEELQVAHRRLSHYRFAHALFQSYLYNGLGTGERLLLHQEVAAVLEELYVGRTEELAVQLARHYAGAGDARRERHYAKLAGERAETGFAHDEALRFFSRALELTPEEDHAERYALLAAREKVYDLQGAREAQIQDLAALEELVDTLADDARRAEVALRQANYAEVTGDYPAAITAAQAAIRLGQTSQAVSTQAEAYRKWGLSLFRHGDYEAARSQLEQALALARAAGSRRVEADSLRNLGHVSWSQGDYARASVHYERALRLHREIGDRRGESKVLGNMSHFSSVQGDYAAAKAHHEQATRIIREIGDRELEAWTLSNLGEIARRQGDCAGARAYYEQALDICREIGDQRHEATVLCDLALVSSHLGNVEAAREYSQQALLIAQDTGSGSLQGFALTNLGHALVSLGHMAKAADAYQQAMGLRREMGQPHLATEPLAGLAHVALAQGDARQAQAHVDEILNHLESGTLAGTDEPFRIYLTCLRVLRANGDPRAEELLKTAHRLLQEDAAKIDDEKLRRSFLENVAAHREIVEEYSRLG